MTEVDFDQISSYQRYKLMASLIVPRPIALVTTLGANGVVNAAPFSMFNMIGEDPPILMISINRLQDGRLKDTAANILHNGEFVVHMSDEPMAQKMHEAGYLPDNSGDTLLNALKNDARSGPVYSNLDLPENAWRAAREAEMGAPPGAEAIPIPVPFDEFQRLRRSAGALGAKVGERTGGETEAGVLSKIQEIFTQKATPIDGLKGGGGVSEVDQGVRIHPIGTGEGADD